MKPRILVSKCLEHDHCRYDGSMIKSDFVAALRDHVDFITVCPEMAIGLPSPREAIRLVKRDEIELLGSMSGSDYSQSMKAFTNSFIEDLEVQGAILKSRSPTCGIKDVKVYGDIGKVPCLDMKTEGVFGGAVMAANPYIPVEDEGRLRNYDIRHHFLTRLYVMWDFHQIKGSMSIHELMRFQSRHKYLLMTYHQLLQKKMGKLLADNSNISETYGLYEDLLHKALLNPMKPGRNINMMMHIFGYFSKYLNNDEKAYFLEQLDLYRLRKLPFLSLMSVLYAWVIRFDIKYLKDQTIFKPYPRTIMDMLDSGKGVIR